MKNSRKLLRRWYVILPLATLVLLSQYFFLSNLLDYKSYRIPSSGMEDALFRGDFFVANMSAFENNNPKAGDILIFIFPGDGITKYVQRCVAVPGDTVEIVDKVLYINGKLDASIPSVKFVDTTSDGEQIVQPRHLDEKGSRDNFGPFVVPTDQYFVMGDNRDNSFDSRYWLTVPRENILGKPWRIYLSSEMSRVGLLIK